MDDKEWNEIVAMLQQESTVNVQKKVPQADSVRRRTARKKARRRRKIRHCILAIVIIIVFGIMLCCKSCSSGDHSIIGTWDYDSATVYRFDKKGRGALVLPHESIDFKYQIEEGKLFIDFESEKATDAAYSYIVNDDNLTLEKIGTSNEVYVFNRID
ncbi:MAG: hypothetical protein KBS74_06175 [Clostridiales bacterium]|nr:hypothetical protein [Candidatus Cacconaster stercorequi]